MKMILSMVHREDAEGLVQALTTVGFRATQLSCTGGFLREGMITLLIGTNTQNIPRALELIKAHTRPHTTPTPAWRRLLAPAGAEQVVSAAATVFVVDLDTLLRY